MLSAQRFICILHLGTALAMATLYSKMSNPDVDSDGFQIVKSKRFSKNKSTKIPPKQQEFCKNNVSVNVDKVIDRINSAVDDLKQSIYLEEVLKTVSNILHGRKVVEIVGLGLGQISECIISTYQLALLLCLKDTLSPEKVFTHDPIFYDGECELLNKLGCKVIEENTEGSYVISENRPTIVYLPHCPNQLTNNFLWSNWGLNLKNCILICNSFTSFIDNQPSKILSETVPYIYRIFPHTSEHSLNNNFKFTDIFNNISIHEFSESNLEKIDTDFWIKGDKPTYKNSEEFITSLMVQKLNI